MIAILARLRDHRDAVRRIVERIAGLEAAERETALGQLLILAGLRQFEVAVEREARKMPILNSILDHKVLGREFKKGELTIIRRLIEKRFGAIPGWAEERLAARSPAELEDLSVRVLDVHTPPAVVFQSRRVVARARRRAAFRDTFDLLLLAGVDGLFLRWPRAHVPAFDRADSLLVLVMLNALLVAYMWLARSIPRWNARRVASTWCVAERSRLMSRVQR